MKKLIQKFGIGAFAVACAVAVVLYFTTMTEMAVASSSAFQQVENAQNENELTAPELLPGMVNMETRTQYGWSEKITQTYPPRDSVSSSGDNGRLVKIEQKSGHNRMAYMFLNSTVYVEVKGLGSNSWSKDVTIHGISVWLNPATTEVLSVNWSPDRGYLITFKEGDTTRTEWLNFRSEVFRKLLGDKGGGNIIDRITSIEYQHYSVL